jgi:hypothetical protein
LMFLMRIFFGGRPPERSATPISYKVSQMPDQTSYQQLQPEERFAIASLRLQDVSIRPVARVLGRSPATVS